MTTMIELTCKNCGGNLDPKTLKCTYCDTQYISKEDKNIKIDRERQIVEEERFLYKDYPCVVLFMGMGHRCGYVGVPKEQIGLVENAEETISCHGGITYGPSDHLHLQNDIDILWIGFDTAHWGDRNDVKKAVDYFGEDAHTYDFGCGTIRTLEYCKRECMDIVDQVIKMIEEER